MDELLKALYRRLGYYGYIKLYAVIDDALKEDEKRYVLQRLKHYAILWMIDKQYQFPPDVVESVRQLITRLQRTLPTEINGEELNLLIHEVYVKTYTNKTKFKINEWFDAVLGGKLVHWSSYEIGYRNYDIKSTYRGEDALHFILGRIRTP